MNRKSSHVIVKTHHPIMMRLMIALLIAATVAAGWWLFEYGRDRAGFDSTLAEQERELLRARIRDLEQQNEQLSSQNSILVQASEIDRQAYGQVDSTLGELQSEVLELKQEIDFYRGIVSPSGVRGLRVQGFSLIANGQPDHYRYTLILSQFVKDQRFVKGVVRLAFIGMRDGEQQTLSLSDVAQPVKSGIQFRFKYFQELQGDIQLPTGFEPLRVEVQAIPNGKHLKAINETYSWIDLVS